ncbi:MAG TPA: histidine kinase [Acidimicrobiales bacterium]|nr:histidine kinase [Acidimicrobiales bacterium]
MTADMTTVAEGLVVEPEPLERAGGRASPLPGLLAALVSGLAVAGVVLARGNGSLDPHVERAALVVAWAVAGVVVSVRRPGERLGHLVLGAAMVGAVAALAAGAIASSPDGGVEDLARLALPLSVGLLPAASMHVLFGLPDGACRVRRTAVVSAYAIGALVGVLLWLDRPSLPLWPVAVEASVAAATGLVVSNHRYRRSQGTERQRMQWFGWAVVVGAEVALVALASRLFSGWPDDGGLIAVLATLPIPIALILGSSKQLIGRIDSLLAHTVSLAGLSGVIVAVYSVIVLGLGRTPTDDERPLLGLSMAAAAVAAILYGPARVRLVRFSNRVVYGDREPPDEVLRTFGSRMSRSVPLDELLLQVAESVRTSLGRQAAEVWTGSEGDFQRTVSVPDAPVAHLTLNPSEEAVVARAGVSGPAWAKVWLPQLLKGREDCLLRVAPMVHSGKLHGLIVAVRPPDGDAFREEDELALVELARQVAVALHNVKLDSALQASLDEVRRQAEELRASRARIVAASDAARRQIERNLHDGAQQHLVALAVNIRLARTLAEADPDSAKMVLDELATGIQDAVQELRSLAHGIYPPLLVDRGLVEALSAAARRAALPTDLQAEGVGRHPADVEAAVYFCCLEALQNAGKHAGEGATATVRIWEEEGGLLFEVADNGAGFDLSERKSDGAGFVNMGDRVGAIGGSLAVHSAPGQGTRISGRIPIDG